MESTITLKTTCILSFPHLYNIFEIFDRLGEQLLMWYTTGTSVSGWAQVYMSEARHVTIVCLLFGMADPSEQNLWALIYPLMHSLAGHPRTVYRYRAF